SKTKTEYLHWYGWLFGESMTFEFNLVKKLQAWLSLKADGWTLPPLILTSREKNALFRGELGKVTGQKKYKSLMDEILNTGGFNESFTPLQIFRCQEF